MSVRVVVVDDQPTIRMGLRMILDHEPGIETVGEAGDGEGCLTEVLARQPDVVVLDVRMPGMDGVEATRRLRADPRTAAVRILVLTTFDDEEYLVGALRAGADAFLLKDSEPATLISTVQAVSRGESVVDPKVTGRLVRRWRDLDSVTAQAPVTIPVSLSERDRKVLVALARGRTNRQIGVELGLSESAVKAQVHGLLSRTGCVSRAQLVARAYEWGVAGA
ncbi:MAG: response regulator transcription factor [Micrococcales bacterium]|nr:response regulator transcription factor [Micrococcales bacterium]